MARKCAAGMVVFVSSGFSEWQRPGSEPRASPGSPEHLTFVVLVKGTPTVQGIELMSPPWRYPQPLPPGSLGGIQYSPKHH